MAALLVGIGLVVWAYVIVSSHERAFRRYRNAFPDNDMKDTPSDQVDARVRQVVDEYKASVTPGAPRPDATALVTARLGALAMTQERWVKFLATTSVAVGLLGTFVGLVHRRVNSFPII